MKRLTKLEIVKETIEYYHDHPERRAMNETSCQYMDDKGNKCALGRCFNDKADFTYQGTAWGYNKDNNIDLHLKTQYKGHDIDFWSDIQEYHDFESFWDENGITRKGIEMENYLLEKYSDETTNRL